MAGRSNNAANVATLSEIQQRQITHANQIEKE